MTQSPPLLTPRNVAPLLVPALIALEFSAGLLQGWLLPLLGEIGTAYKLSGGAVGWVLTVALLSSAVCVPMLTMVADRFGHRRLLVISAAFTALGTLLIAIAPNFAVLLLGAAVQGPVAALLPLEMAILKRHRPGRANQIIGLLVGTLTFGLAIGALGAGFMMEATRNLGLTQLVPAVVAGVVAGLLVFFVPPAPGDVNRTVDWLGAGLLGFALIGLMYGLSEGPVSGWGSVTTLFPILAGTIFFIAFVVVEVRVRTPLVDLRVLRSARLTTPLLIGALVAMGMFGSQTPMVLYLTSDPGSVGYGAGVSVGAVGLIFAITGVASSLGSFVAPLVVRAFGVRATTITAALLVAVAFLALTSDPANPVLATAIFVVVWFGAGIAFAVLPGVVIDRAPEESAATVSGLYSTGRTIGGSLAGAAVATVLTAVTLASLPASTDPADALTPALGFHIVWVLLAALLVVAAILAGFLTRSRKAEQEATAHLDSNAATTTDTVTTTGAPA